MNIQRTTINLFSPATVCLILLLSSCTTPANDQGDEIGILLALLDATECTFIRNDVSYSSDEFLFHLQSKMQRNIDLVEDGDDFIELIGTRSAESGIPYVAVCEGELVITRDWFTQELAKYRDI